MPIRPIGATCTLGGQALILEEAQQTVVVEFFDRLEFEHNKLRQAKNIDGSLPIYISLFGGRVAQLTTTCSGSVAARPITPDDSDVNNIKKRWDITRFILRGGPSLAANVNALITTAQTHKDLYAKFQAHLAKAQLDISYDALITMQSETFSYLTSGGISFSSNGLSGTVLFFREYQTGVEFDTPSGQVYKSWSATLDKFVLNNAGA